MRVVCLLLLLLATGCSGQADGLLEPSEQSATSAESDDESGRENVRPDVDRNTDANGATDDHTDPDEDRPQPSGSDSTTPDPDARPYCEDRLTGTAVVAGPQGIMVQLSSVGDECELQRALDHVCKAHPEMKDLLVTSVEKHHNGQVVAEADLERMSWLTPYFGCFRNVFVGTVSETMLADPYSNATVLNADSRWSWLRAAKSVAEQVGEWMDAEVGDDWHWYVSYEANLNAFTDTPYRNAYVAMLQQHIADLDAVHDGVIAWSPTFWIDPSSLDSNQRTMLRSALTDLFERVPVDWVLIQDHIGVNPSWTCEDALAYYDIVRAAGSGLSSVQLNMEYFTIDAAGIRAGDPSDLAARLACYQRAGASVGASFEYRYWYDTHGH